MVKTAVHMDPFKSRVQGHALPYFAFNQLSLYCPLVRCLSIPKPFAESVDEHETGYILVVGACISLCRLDRHRVPDKHVGHRLTSGVQQGMQICNRRSLHARLV